VSVDVGKQSFIIWLLSFFMLRMIKLTAVVYCDMDDVISEHMSRRQSGSTAAVSHIAAVLRGIQAVKEFFRRRWQLAVGGCRKKARALLDTTHDDTPRHCTYSSLKEHLPEKPPGRSGSRRSVQTELRVEAAAHPRP
jgi:hypothetical protein